MSIRSLNAYYPKAEADLAISEARLWEDWFELRSTLRGYTGLTADDLKTIEKADEIMATVKILTRTYRQVMCLLQSAIETLEPILKRHLPPGIMLRLEA